MSDFRKVEQISADDFDLEIFRLVRKAEDKADLPNHNEEQWKKIADTLDRARLFVRAMMHKEDLKTTR